MTKGFYLQQQQIIQNRLIKHFVPKVEAAIRDQISAAVEAIKKNPNTINGVIDSDSAMVIRHAIGKTHGDVIDFEMAKIIRDLYRTAAVAALKKYKPIKRETKGFGFNDTFVKSILDYFAKFLLNKVVIPISKTTTAFIEKTLQEAITKGWGVDETVKHLQNTDVPLKRARVIVRTESVRAMNFSQLVAADSEDFEMEKRWLAIEDRRTRDSHSDHGGVDGEQISLYDKFSNGLMYPGDEEGEAAEICNCRCTLIYIAARDSKNRLIPKKDKAMNIFTALGINKMAA